MLVADDSARWMAAAEGTVALEPARLGPPPLLGLTSALLLRERSPGLVRGTACGRLVWREGDVSREDMGEFAADGELDALRDRGPLSVFWRRGTRDPLSEAADGLLVLEESWVEAMEVLAGAGEAVVAAVVVVEVVDGSALSTTPAMDWKESASEVMLGVQRAVRLACWTCGDYVDSGSEGHCSQPSDRR